MQHWELVARESVRATMAAYNFGGDRGRLDELAAAFVPDGVLQIGDDPPIVGREAIADTLRVAVAPDPVPRFLHHHVANVHFLSVAPDVIESSAYFEVLTDSGLDHWGRYRDRFVPFEDTWLLAHRRVVTEGFAVDSCFR